MKGIFGPVIFILPDLLLAFQEDREVLPVAGVGSFDEDMILFFYDDDDDVEDEDACLSYCW